METFPTNAQDRLLQALESLKGEGARLYAVMEGAHFDNIQFDLTNLGLEYRPLYLTEGDMTNQIAGPHLIIVPNRLKIEQVLELGRGKPCIVWWGWPDQGEKTTDNLVKHLRSINMVEIPRERYDAEPEDDAPGEDSHTHDHDHGHEEKSEFEGVLFRHADPNVMVSLLPLLTDVQLGRLFGAATGLAMHAPDYGEGDEGVRYAPRKPDLPPKHAGLMRIDHQQYEALGEQSIKTSIKRIVDFLRWHVPPDFENASDSELTKIATRARKSGKTLGFQSEQAHARWAYLMMISNGKVAKSPEIKSLFHRKNSNPDNDVKTLIDLAAGQIAQGNLG